MRIDKFLWFVRLYKTRTLAQDAIKIGRVRIGGQQIKSSYELKINDVFTIRHPPFDFTYTVLAFPKGRLGAALVSEYLRNDTPTTILEELIAIRANAAFVRDRGAGRPTKRDRRELLQYIDFANSDYSFDEDLDESDEN